MFTISKFNTEYQTVLSGKFDFKDLIKFIYLSPSFVKRVVELKEIKKIIKEKNFKIEDSIIITSEERSGSTWLMEILNSSKRITINWEPFHEKLGVLPEKYKFGVRPFIKENKKNNEFKKLFKNIFELKSINIWTANYLEIESIRNAEFILTKSVKFNLSLPWLVKNFNFSKKPILLLRHPIPVILSQEKNFNQNIYKDYLFSDSYNNERFNKNKNYLMTLNSKLEKRIAIWCLNNISTIRNKNNNIKWNLIFYENLVINPAVEFKKIEKEYNLKLNWKTINFNKVSSSSGNSNSNRENVLSSWENELNIEEKVKIQNIFDHFGLKIYNAFSSIPL